MRRPLRGCALIAVVAALAACVPAEPSDVDGDASTDATSQATAGAASEEAAGERAFDETELSASVDAELTVHFLDVGQADATLLLHPDVTVLIDQGDWRRTDVIEHLDRLEVDHVDLMITTHPHADHLGQFDVIMDTVEVAEVWWSGAVHTTRTFERAVAALEASEAAYEEPRSGDRATLGPLLFEILNPPDDADFDDLHDSGLATRISYGDVRFVFTGDIESATEARMVERDAESLAGEILQLGHHGSSTSTTDAFLAAVDPGVAIYSAGVDNMYGHPHEEVIERLEMAGIPTYGTDVHGTIVVTTDGASFEVDTDRAGTVSIDQPSDEP